jgi:3'-phosphoadenosine 5'-phosphosulfate sulfotransferase (PAPS reductase)/FAD synthetase
MNLLDKGIEIIGELKRKYKCVVTLSGGKDSQACLMLAIKEFGNKNILALFCDTKFEHPITYAHVKQVVNDNNIDLIVLNSGSVLSICTKYKRFPGGGARHCTDELKIRPSKFFYEALAHEQGGFEVWYGMRSDESAERAERYKGKTNNDSYPPHEVMSKYPKKLHKLGVSFKLPILNWSTDEVFSLLDGKENELYSHGFERVGCFPCLAGGEGHQMRAFYFDDIGLKHYKIAEQISEIAGRPVLISKKYYDQGPGCALCSI